MNEEVRLSNQRLINSYVHKAFSQKSSMTLAEFSQFNNCVSSEMFVSVLRTLQERIPCSMYVFSLKREFK